MIWFLWALAGTYALGTLWLFWGWQWLPMPTAASNDPASLPSLTVVIPVRNEAANLPNLLADLNQQTYRNFEVIVADDASTDATVTLAQTFAQTAPYPLTVLALADDPTVASPKKRAIAQSIERATGTLIVTTDGDCRVGPRWLNTIARFQARSGAKLVSGPVTFTTDRSVFGSLQTVEFASLIGAGAATMAHARPTMCNGANLCYQKAVFRDVGGFSGIDQVASGDDELLMHKIAAQYPGGVRFLKDRDAIVETAAHASLIAFYRQRKRWAGKWRTYTSLFPTMLAVVVFLCNLTPLLALAGWALGTVSADAALAVILLKIVPEWLFLVSVLLFLRKRSALWWIPATQLIYPFYVVFFGLAAQQPGVIWKGRRLQ
ncbi:glycosyl transferase family 2 [Fibrella aestuarina BUZ 2]|uniref:Glycosyl transferase family 2 n=1 Tax=Fibrella aestuarina BUZ 2 TaxID=1166018 RepID=I0K7T9_9BACT|nr:glycosyltransferase [Fibrella aestuarina]CCH00192.1 glycosyl transferase family 2 [Fibrella aestuarina BUZ 2]